MLHLKNQSVRLALILIASISVLSGCGFKDKPLPPEQVIPRAITDLRYQLSDKGVTLLWSYPTTTVTGGDITEISEFELQRAVIPMDDYCKSCPIPFGQAIKLPGGQVPDKGRKTGSYEGVLLRPGNMYFFKIRSVAGWWATSKDSNIVSFLWNIPARAPEGVTARAADGSIQLHWRPVTNHRDGSSLSEAVRYQVYRSMGGAAFKKIGEPVEGTTFVDKSPINGRKYLYKVQAISVYAQATVGGGMSKAVSAAAVDRTPPAPPHGVRAVRTAKAIKIFWQAVTDKDLKGYRVYRRLDGQQERVMIGEAPAPYVLFTDKTPPSGARRIFYSVSSFDKQQPGNESERSPEVMISR